MTRKKAAGASPKSKRGRKKWHLGTLAAERAVQILTAAKHLRAADEVFDELPLSEAELSCIGRAEGLDQGIRQKLGLGVPLTVSEAAALAKFAADSVPNASPQTQRLLLSSAEELVQSLWEKLTEISCDESHDAPPAECVFQIKITLLGTDPPIWRRVVVPDCTLGSLHDLIQCAMGWGDEHAHQFVVQDIIYGDLEQLGDCLHEQAVLLSNIVPLHCRRFRFHYEYDFGDSWTHEILFENRREPEKGQTYPRCLEGELACPPEDIGGVWGYYDAIEDLKSMKEKYLQELCDLPLDFDPEAFSPIAATRAMRRALKRKC